MDIFGEDGKEEENLIPLSEKFTLEQVKNSQVKVSHKYTLGQIEIPTFCVRYSPDDKYIAQGCGDGSIRIYNTYTGKLYNVFNTEMEQPMPCMCIRWRPPNSKAVSKNVILTANANGSVQHWHTTSGKLLHTTFDELNQYYTCDYNNDGSQYATGGKDQKIRVYDEQTRKLVIELEGGGSGENGHSNRIYCVKFDPNDPNFLISGGWDRTVIVWDIRLGNPVRHFYGPSITGDSIDLSNEVIMTGSKLTEEQTMQMWEYTSCEHFTDINWDEGLPSEKKCPVFAL
jgi:COMPASS component SWD3